MSEIAIDQQLVQEVAARLDLRDPNREALQSIAMELSRHYDVLEQTPPFEGVVDVATGIGKTYIMAATIDYLATARAVRNFAVITPGRTILRKTEANFTLGHVKSLLGTMAVRPVVITADNFNTPAMRAVMDDLEQVKLYIFTVQALTKPQTDVARKTHKFQEGLGKAFYEHLRSLYDLVIFADEHHIYYSDAFSKAIRDLTPYALIGLTATPHRKTPEDQIIYRYPLAAGIAAQLVKTPVIVGRRDDRTDTATKLLDGIRLLEYKAKTVAWYCDRTGKPLVNPVMLVISKEIEDAEECRRLIEDPTFAGGVYADKVLVIHSNAPDEALEKLDTVEDANSPVRIIISVGMLKEGWDVKNVYVIVSLRASISDILTEQTLGRGLRLAFGTYTGVEMLDTLEVLAHERYEDLLRRSNVLNEAFIDYRTRAVLRTNSLGQSVVTRETTRVGTQMAPITVTANDEAPTLTGAPRVASTEQRLERAEHELTLRHELAPRPNMPILCIPRLMMTAVKANFSLADITDYDQFRKLGERIAADPASQLRRTTVSARIVEGTDGFRRTELVTATAVDTVYSQAPLVKNADPVDELRQRMLNSSSVPARKGERLAAEPLLEAFLSGLGPKTAQILGAYPERAADALVAQITAEQRRFASKPQFDEIVKVEAFAPVRTARSSVTENRHGPFSKTVGYEGWRKSMYAQAWFDSEPERAVANMLDEASVVACWLRLERGDLPILWNGFNNWYHPDFVVIEREGMHWIIEVKADQEMESPDVHSKSEAAKRWANHISSDEGLNTRWRYLLVSETQVRAARDSWTALKRYAL